MDMPLAEMQRQLRTLRLHGMNATLETRLVQANQGASFPEVFACLLQDEIVSTDPVVATKNTRIFSAKAKE